MLSMHILFQISILFWTSFFLSSCSTDIICR
jgi:hypothetical protein